MKTKIVLLLGVLCLGLVLATLPRSLTAQDPVKVAPDVYQARLDNERVRVLEIRLPVGAEAPMHSHPAHVCYALTAFKVRFTSADGTTKDLEAKAGDVMFHEAVTHATKNVGDTEARVLLMELKEPAARTAANVGDVLNVRFQDLKWEPLYPELGDASPERAIVRVDPHTQATQMFIRACKEYYFPRHWHSANKTVAVLSGTLLLERDDQCTELGNGSFCYVPAKQICEATLLPGKEFFLGFCTMDGAWDVNLVESQAHEIEDVNLFPDNEERPRHILLTPADIKWQDGPAGLPPGAKMAILEGDLQKTEPFTLRLKVPADYKVPPHWHPAVEHVTILSGRCQFGLGDQADPGKMHKMPTGSFMVMPVKMPHFVWAEEETVVQLHGIGPWDIIYLNPADDPRKK